MGFVGHILAVLAALALLLQSWAPLAARPDARLLSAVSHAVCGASAAKELTAALGKALSKPKPGAPHPCEEHCQGCGAFDAAAVAPVWQAAIVAPFLAGGESIPPSANRHQAHRPRGPPLGSRAPPSFV